MPCPTCDHTLNGIGHEMFHCPRCGTLVGCPSPDASCVPALVRRCRYFAEHLTTPPALTDKAQLAATWREMGVAEAIDRPGSRNP